MRVPRPPAGEIQRPSNQPEENGIERWRRGGKSSMRPWLQRCHGIRRGQGTSPAEGPEDRPAMAGADTAPQYPPRAREAGPGQARKGAGVGAAGPDVGSDHRRSMAAPMPEN